MHFCKYRLQKVVLIAVIGLVLTSCAVGPDFKSPSAPNTQRYTEKNLPKKTASASGVGGQAQNFVSSQTIQADWWTLFRCPELSNLVQQGLANNQNFAAAQAALRQAQETLTAQIGTSYYPNVSLSVAGGRQAFSGATYGSDAFPSATFNLYNTAVNVSYPLDVFGLARRQVESSKAQVDYQYYQLAAAYITLSANIVTTAVTTAALKAQIDATHQLIQSQEEQLAIMQKQYRLGGVSGADLLAQQTLVAQTRATLPPLEQNLAQNRHALAVLVGALPSESNLPQLDLNQLHLPTRLPVSLPSSLVRQRPDVGAAEALLHSTTAQVGVATANLFPQFAITGNFGSVANNPAKLFTPNDLAWAYALQMTQPVFNGGALRAQRRAAIAAMDQSYAQYRQTVLQAFKNVADTLRALENDALSLQAQEQAEFAARGTLRITEKQYKLGGVSYLQLLNAQRQYQTARINRIQAQALRYNDTAALFLALGGGWWNRPEALTVPVNGKKIS